MVPTEDSAERPYPAGIALAGALVLCGLAILDWLHPFIVLRSQFANGLAFTVIILLAPWAALVFARDLAKKWPRRVGIATTAIIAVASLPLALLGACSAAFVEWERISTIDTGHHTIAIYQTDCGATCSYGLIIRQEREILPGVVMVHDLDRFHPGADPATEVLSPDSVRITIPPYGDRAPERSRVYRLTVLP